jgi:hypothetical protein
MPTPTNALLSPAQKQYRGFKAKHPGYVLFFRMGDFYELFWEDAQLAASVLGLALTTRSRSASEPIAMAGIPFHALEESLKKMMAEGYKCAVCEMVASELGIESPRKIVRKVVPASLHWNRIAGDGGSADLSRAGPYVISHRPSEHTVSYRPPGEHSHIGTFATEAEAKSAAERHINPPPRKRRSFIASVECELRQSGIPHVSIDEAKKALFTGSKLKAFHFVVYDKKAENWLLWCGEPTAAIRQDMTEWANVFGQGFQVAYAVRRARGIIYKSSSGTRLTLNGDGSSRSTSTAVRPLTQPTT